MKAADRVALNTGVQYLKMFLTSLISLYTTRLALNALGLSDFGIYNLISGMVAMLSFLNTAMATGTLRFLSYTMGEDAGSLKAIFTNALILHFIIALIIFLLLEVAGYVLFRAVLDLPTEKISTAKVIYQFMVFGTFVLVVSVPYDALTIAHEDMIPFTVIMTLDSVLKLLIVIVLNHISYDRLLIYGILVPLSGVIILLLKRLYAKYKYPHIAGSVRYTADKSLMKKMASFVGWNLLESFSMVFSSQGISLLLNNFFGTVANAAYAVSQQVNGYMGLCSAKLISAINPQIVKSEGSNNRERMLRLSKSASKTSFFLMAVFSIPVIIEMPELLNLWLKDVPQHTSLFCRMIILASLINQLTLGLHTAMLSVGRIKYYQVVLAFIHVGVILSGYILYSSGFPIHTVFIVVITGQICIGMTRLCFAYLVTGVDAGNYVYEIILKSAAAYVLVFFICYTSFAGVTFGLVRFFLLFVCSFLSYSTLFFLFVLSKYEKNILTGMFKTFAERL